MTGDAEQIFARIRKTRLMPVVVVGAAADGIRLARALISDGLSVTEVPLRRDTAAETIRRSTAKVPAGAPGAGTVLIPDHVKADTNEDLPIVPGANNPVRVEPAMSAGLAGVKFFPTGPTTGIPIPKALTAPQGVTRFIPAGGIGPGNLHGRLILNAALACKASWLVDPLSVPASRFHRLQRLTFGAVAPAQAS